MLMQPLHLLHYLHKCFLIILTTPHQWRVQSMRLGDSNIRGRQKGLHLFKYPKFSVTIVGYHTKVVIFYKTRKWLFFV